MAAYPLVGATTELSPNLDSLLTDLESVTNWQVLGIRLGMEKSNLEAIANECQGDVELCKTKMYDMWLRSKITWREIVEALYLMKEDVLANTIRRTYLKPSTAFPKDFADLPHHTKRSIVSKVFRKNYSFLYHQLNHIDLIQSMPAWFEDSTDKMENIASYESMFAQKAVVINALLKEKIDLHETCVALETEQKHIAEKLVQDCKRELSAVSNAPSSLRVESLVHSDMSCLSREFLVFVEAVIADIELQPYALTKLKQALALLTLPLLDDEIVSLVEPTSYEGSQTTRELIRQISPYFNCLNVDLLHLIIELCSFDSVFIERVEDYQSALHTKYNTLVLCVQAPLQSPSIGSDATIGAMSAHSAPIADLQSRHPPVFARLPEHMGVMDRFDAVRLSVEVNAPILRLSDYEDTLMAISGFFEVPKAALTYIGCSESPLVLCWLISHQVYEYMKCSVGGIAGEVLLSQQGIVSIAIGDDVRYVCCTIPESQLYEGAHFNLFERVQDLVKSGVNVNKQTYQGFTAVFRASCDGHSSIVEYLIKAGANIHIQNNNGATALLLASQEGHERNVEILIHAGAVLDIQGSDGTTPLSVSCQEGHEKIVHLLIQAGANVDNQGKEGATPLYMASQNGHEKIVQLLLEAGASVDTQCDDGTTALMVACFNGNEKVVDYLLEAGAQPNLQDNFRKNSALIWATRCRVEQTNIVRMLLEHGADVNIIGKTSMTALEIADDKGYTEVSQLLRNALP